MTRLRYIVDRPRGPRGGNNESLALYRDFGPAKRNAEPREPRYRDDRRRPEGKVLVVDLDMLLHVFASIDEQFEHHERMALYHTCEAMRLKPDGKPATADVTFLTPHDIAWLREAVDEYDAEFARLKDKSKADKGCIVARLQILRRAGKLG